MKLVTLFSTLLSISSFAATFDVKPGTATRDGVTLGASADVTTDSAEVIRVDSVGAGTRAKKVGLFNIKVYVAQLFVSDLAKLDHTNANILASLAGMKASALRLTFVRGVTSDQLIESFKAALTVNGVDMARADVVSFINVFSKMSPNNGDTMDFVALDQGTFLINVKSSTAVLKASSVVKIPANDVYSMWFGKPADAGIAAAKKDILGT